MKVVVLYHPISEHARHVEEYAHDFERTKNIPMQKISLETPEGAHLARLYDIVQYPAIAVTQDNGNLMKHWEGMPLPLMNEVAGYFH